MSEMITAEQLLAMPDAETITKEIDLTAYGWPGAVRVRALSLGERDECRERAYDKGKWRQEWFDGMALAKGLVEPAITEDQAEALLAKPFGPLQVVLEAIMTLSCLTTKGEVAAQAVDDAEAAFRPQEA